MHFNFAVTESRNYGVTEGHDKSSIAPLFQSGALIIMDMDHIHVHTLQKYMPKQCLFPDMHYIPQ